MCVRTDLQPQISPEGHLEGHLEDSSTVGLLGPFAYYAYIIIEYNVYSPIQQIT